MAQCGCLPEGMGDVAKKFGISLVFTLGKTKIGNKIGINMGINMLLKLGDWWLLTPIITAMKNWYISMRSFHICHLLNTGKLTCQHWSLTTMKKYYTGSLMIIRMFFRGLQLARHHLKSKKNMWDELAHAGI